MNTIRRSGTLKALLWTGIVVVVGLCASQAEAATILVSEGVITAGTDTSGLFGVAGADLAGNSYKLFITYDDFSVAFHSNSATFEKELGPMTGVVTVTVNGITFAPAVTKSFGALLYANNNGSFSELVGFQSGNDAQGQAVYASHDLSSTTGRVTGPAIGPTTYTAVAGDIGSVTLRTSGPEGTASFTATPAFAAVVYPPSQLIDSLAAYVDGLGLPKGTETSLVHAKLDTAKTSFAIGYVAAAIGAINSFISEVKAQSGKKITVSEAANMINQAQAIITSIQILYSIGG
jgi:hypothetical protein